MKIIFTSAARHLEPFFSSVSQKFTSIAFSDGERYVKVPSDVAGQNVWVVTNTIAPAENLIELFLLLDALQRLGSTIHLLFTYFAYARQDRALSGQALGVQMIATLLKQFRIKEIHLIHIHSQALSSYLPSSNHIPYSFFSQCIQRLPIDVIIAPDKGAGDLVERISKQENKAAAFLEKKRSALEQTKIIALNGDVSGKNVLIIDDMISTAGTIVHAAQLLREKGAQEIYVAATHGIFSDGTIQKIATSNIKHVLITNTVPFKQESPKISVIDISSVISEIIFKNL